MTDKQTKTKKILYYTNNLCDSSYMIQYIFMFIIRKHYLNELCLFKNNLKYKTLGHASCRYNNKKVTNIPESPSGDSQEEPRQHQMVESSSVTEMISSLLLTTQRKKHQLCFSNKMATLQIHTR